MAEKLTVVVTCTDRKSLQVSNEVQLRNLPAGGDTIRTKKWLRRIDRTSPTVPLRELYQGEMWMQALQLEKAALSLTRRVETLVASAGLGLRSWDDVAPAYSATFMTRQPDSVASDSLGMARWWQSINELGGRPGLRDIESSKVLLVLSASYAQAVHDDLVALGNSRGPQDVLLVGGARDIPGVSRVPAEGTLRNHFGGSLVSLNTRIAHRWLLMGDLASVTSGRRFREWNEWVLGAEPVPPINRQPQTDVQVRRFIAKLLRHEPSLSCTKALRALRDAGFACEQKRFTSLYRLEAL